MRLKLLPSPHNAGFCLSVYLLTSEGIFIIFTLFFLSPLEEVGPCLFIESSYRSFRHTVGTMIMYLY